ncbi:MAG: TetR/AcrR family transcriptional regulator [Anaerolineae bacterium]|nr:TetR/AcrR family transcriptional regulator [Anaerolineae bacterium]
MPRPNVSEQRKQDILQAAAMVFTRDGLATARMDDVAQAAGISKGTVYLYYPSKEVLIEALVARLFMPLDVALEALLAGEGGALVRLRGYGEAVIGAFADAAPLHPLILELFALARRQSFAGQLMAGYFMRYRDGLSALLGEAASFMATLEGVLLLVLVVPELFDLRQAGGETVESWLRQVTPV